MERYAAFSRIEDSDTLRIRWSEPLAWGTLVFEHRKSGSVHRVPIGGRESEIHLPSVGLAPGRWHVLLDEGHGGRLVPTTDPGFSLDGLRAYAQRARETSFRALRTRGGTLRLVVRAVEPHAEVSRVRACGGTVRIEGWTAYLGPGADDAPARLSAVPRNAGEPVVGTARLENGSFHGELTTAPLAAGQRDEVVYWDLAIEAGDVRMPVAALLDDMPEKKRKVRFPTQTEPGPEDHRVDVRPYFTDKERLAVSCALRTPEQP